MWVSQRVEYWLAALYREKRPEKWSRGKRVGVWVYHGVECWLAALYSEKRLEKWSRENRVGVWVSHRVEYLFQGVKNDDL